MQNERETLGGRETVDYAAMVEAGAHLFSDDGIPIDDQAVLASAMEQIARLGFAISLHEEDRRLTANGAVNAGEVSKRLGVAGVPAVAETERIRRLVPDGRFVEARETQNLSQILEQLRFGDDGKAVAS